MQLKTPAGFAQGLALFPGEEDHLGTRIGHANILILRTKTEPSRVTRKLMLAEALGIWEDQATDWLKRIVETCASLGVHTTVTALHQQVREALEPLAGDLPAEDDGSSVPDFAGGHHRTFGYDKELLRMDGWTPDPNVIILPADGPTHALSRQILRLDLSKVVLLKARKPARAIAWEKVTLVHLFEGAVIFEIADEPPLVVPGYKHPEEVLATIQKYYKAATERFLQALAKRVTRPTP